MDLTDLHALSATDGARLIRDGVISSEQLWSLVWPECVRSMV